MKALLLAVAQLALAALAVGCRSAPVSTTADQPIRVLLVGSKPTWSFRYFTNAWQRAKNVELLRHLAGVGDSPFGKNMLATLPETVADWQKHDVVVLCEWNASQADEDCVSSLAQFVADGGGLITIAEGKSANSLRDNRWRTLLPVRLAAGPARAEPTKTALAVASGAEEHPALQCCGADEVETVLPTLPELYFTPLVESLAADAKALVQAKAIAQVPANTVMAIRPVGKGFSLWIGTDELWRWRDPHAERYMDAFAVSAVRAVAINRLARTGFATSGWGSASDESGK